MYVCIYVHVYVYEGQILRQLQSSCLHTQTHTNTLTYTYLDNCFDDAEIFLLSPFQGQILQQSSSLSLQFDVTGQKGLNLIAAITLDGETVAEETVEVVCVCVGVVEVVLLAMYESYVVCVYVCVYVCVCMCVCMCL